MANNVVTQPMNAAVAPMPVNVQNVQVINTNHPLDIGKKYAKIYHCLGVTQVAFGTLSIIIGLALELVISSLLPFGTAIWCGIFFLVSGTIGIVSGRKPQHRLIVAGMVMSIFSALAASTLVGMEVVEAMEAYYYTFNSYYYNAKAVTALHSILAVMGLVVLIIAIFHSAYCCAPICCSARPQQMVNMAPVPTYNGEVPLQTSAIPGQQVAYVYPGQHNTVTQANQQPAPMYHPTPFPITNQQPNMMHNHVDAQTAEYQMVNMAPVPTYNGEVPLQTSAIPGQQVAYVYPGQHNTVTQANQQPAPMYHPTPFPTTNQQPNMMHNHVDAQTAEYQITDEKAQLLDMP